LAVVTKCPLGCNTAAVVIWGQVVADKWAKNEELLCITSETTFRLLLPNKLFSVFFTMRLLPGVVVFACSTGEMQIFAEILRGDCRTVTLADKLLCGKPFSTPFEYA